MILWITGISGSGKTTLGKYFYKQFIKKYKNTIFLDGDDQKLFKQLIHPNMHDKS